MSPVDRSRLPTVGSEPSFVFPAIAKDRLSNGLEIWRADHRTLSVVTIVLLVRSGSAADPAGAEGLASLTGDMLDEGSGERTAIEMHEELERIGAQFDTEVGADSSVVVLTTLSRYLARGLTLLADMAVRPRLDGRDFGRVRELRVNRLKQLRDSPSSVADRAFVRLVYGAHPYGHQALGTERALQGLSVDDVLQFHQRAYAPSRATLIAVGDFETSELMRAAGQAFGEWADRPGSMAGTLDDGSATPEVTRRLAIVDRPGAAQSELRIGHVAASRDTPDYHALLVLNMILGGQFVSRINLNLREDKGFTYGARTVFDCRRGRGPFVLQTSVQTTATAAAIREARAEIEGIRESRPPTAGELDLARTGLSRGYPRGFETAEQVARAAAQQALYGLPDDYFQQFVPRVSAVNAATVTRVARSYLDPARLTTLIVGDRTSVAPALQAAGLGEPEPVEAP